MAEVRVLSVRPHDQSVGTLTQFAGELVSTIPYIPNDRMVLKVSRTREFTVLDRDELQHMAAKAGVPVKLVLETAARERHDG